MTTDVLHAGRQLRLNRAYSLAQLVSAHHIPIVPTSLALAHKQHMIDESRVGIFRFFGPALYVLTASLEFLFDRGSRRGLWTFLFLLVTTIIGGFLVPDAPTMIVSVMQLAFWAIMAVSTITVGHVVLSIFFTDYNEASTIWERRPVKDKHGYFDLDSVPYHLHDRIRQASSIPDAKVQIERFEVDPLVLVTRRVGLSTEVVYIGGWETGNPLIDKA